jgi:hypothetical protein
MKRIYPHYVFDPAAGTITFTEWPQGAGELEQKSVLMATNLTRRQIIYLPVDPETGGTMAKTPEGDYVLTLDADTSSMSGTDELQIFVDVPSIWHHNKYRVEYGKLVPIPSKGSLVQFDANLKGVNEGVFTDFEVAATASSGERMVQVFRASATCVSEAMVSLEGLITTPVVVDDFEGYASSQALQGSWVGSSPSDVAVSLNTADPAEGSKAMQVWFKASKSIGDRVTRTFSTLQDWGNGKHLRFSFRSDRSTIFMKVVLRDSSSRALETYFHSSDGSWGTISVAFEDFDFPDGSFDTSKVQSLAFEVVDCPENTNVGIDGVQMINDVGSVDVGLVDFGASPPDGTQPLPPYMTLDSGLPTKTISAPSSKTMISVNLPYGMTTANKMTVGNYYGLVITGPSGANSQLKWHGTAQRSYQSGPVLKEEAGGTLTALQGSAGFGIISHIKGYIRKVSIKFSADPGTGSRLVLAYMDPTDPRPLETVVVKTFMENEKDCTLVLEEEDSVKFNDKDVKTLAGFFQSNGDTVAASFTVTVSGSHGDIEVYG